VDDDSVGDLKQLIALRVRTTPFPPPPPPHSPPSRTLIPSPLTFLRHPSPRFSTSLPRPVSWLTLAPNPVACAVELLSQEHELEELQSKHDVLKSQHDSLSAKVSAGFR
jgi:hypothetical protein